MQNFVDEFVGNYGSEVSKQLSSNLGINKSTASQLIPQIAPLILGGLKRQMETRGGAPRVDHILNKYGDANVLNNIAGEVTKRSQDNSPDPRLGGLLGDSGTQAVNTLSQKFNLDGSIVSKVIPMLAPLVLGALTQKRDRDGVGSNGIAALIDQDGDGSVLDDVAGFLLKGIGTTGSQRGGGLLGNVLGGLLGKRR